MKAFNIYIIFVVIGFSASTIFTQPINELNIAEKRTFLENYEFNNYMKAAEINSDIIDFRINEQSGNSQKYNTKSAINENNVSIIVWHDYREGTSNIYAQLINEYGDLIGENIKINSTENNRNYYQPDVSVNSENQFLVVWFDWRSSYAIYGQLIDEKGSFIGENFEISDEGNSSYKTNPSVDANDDQFVVVWTDGRNGSKYDIFAQRLNNDGSKIKKNFIINSDTQSVQKYYPDIAVDSIGNIYTTWLSTVDGLKNIYSAVLDTANIQLAEIKKVNENTSETSTNNNPRISISKLGGMVVWYRYMSGKYDILGQFLDSFGELVDTNIVINDAVTSSRSYPAISSNSDNIMVSWYDRRNGYGQVYAQNFSNDTITGENYKISEDNLNKSKTYVSNSINNNGYFITAWIDYESDSEYKVYARILNEENNPVSESIITDDDEFSSLEQNPDLTVFEDGSSVIVWTDRRERSYKSYFQRINENGELIGSNTQAMPSGSQYYPQVTKLAENNFVVLWRQYYSGIFNQNEIVAQKFYKSGEKIGDSFLISSNEIQGAADDPDLISNNKGEFIAAWEKRINGTYRIFAKKFDADGMLVSDLIKVSQDTTLNYYRPQVGIDSLGNFAIAYYGYTTNGYKVFLNRYNSNAQLIDSVLYVDDKSIQSQYYPSISVNKNGACVIAWMDYRTPNGVYFRKYEDITSNNGLNLIDSSFAVFEYSMSNCSPKVSLNDSGSFIISWNEYNSAFNDLKFRLFDADLLPITDVLYVTGSQMRDQRNQRTLIHNNKIFNVWQDNREYGIGYDIWANSFEIDDLLTSVELEDEQIPNKIELSQNYPNPFNPSTIIEYSIPNLVDANFASTTNVQLKVYDILGREVASLVNRNQKPGNYKVEFDGSRLSSGVYYYRLNIGEVAIIKKMLLLK